jgi:hypothetical protein
MGITAAVRSSSRIIIKSGDIKKGTKEGIL